METRWWLVGLWGVGFLMSGAVGSSFAYQGGPVAEKGSVSGVVKAAGQPPAPKPIEVNKDQAVCGKSQPAESLILGAGNSVKNAVTRLTNISKGKPLDTATKVVLDQAKCRFVPHVVVVPVGATLEIKNSDPITHNVHTFSIENDPINKAQPKTVPIIPTKFTAPEIVKTQCDIHKWMGTWIVAADHPYYVVTDDKGQFKLADVPPGTYQMEIWHETLGKVTKEVTVKANADASVSVELKK
ncbi:MAG: carboxypeptidase regulatory-like domain-containing protein [Nitrospiraceae bacterium]